MKTERLLLSSLLAGGALALALRRTPKITPARPVPSQSPYDEIDAYVQDQMRRLNIPGVSLAIVEGDKIVHLRGFGRARPGGEAPSPQTPFFIGSLTKSFTALAVMQLVEAGKVELDAPGPALPALVPRGGPAGLRPDDGAPPAEPDQRPAQVGRGRSSWPISTTVRAPPSGQRGRCPRSTLTRPAGAAFEYSNSNYNLLGLVIEAASRRALRNRPPGAHTGPPRHEATPTSRRPRPGPGPGGGPPAVVCVSRAGARNPAPAGRRPWRGTRLHRRGHGPLPDRQPRRGPSRPGDPFARRIRGPPPRGGTAGAAGLGRIEQAIAKNLPAFHYGMGWVVDTIGGRRLLWHGGTLPDFGAHMAILPDHGKGVVLLINACHHWMDPALTTFGNGVAALLAGEQPLPCPRSRPFPGCCAACCSSRPCRSPTSWPRGGGCAAGAQDPGSRPRSAAVAGTAHPAPLVPNLLTALALKPVLGKRRGYLKLYMPDIR